MLTNQDRRAILEQVKTSESGDIMAALQGQPILPQQEQMQEQQVQQEPASIPPTTPSPVNNVSMETPPVGQDSLVNSFSNTSPQIQDLPTGSAEPQLLKTGGYVQKYPHGGPHAPPMPENNAKIYPTEEKSWWDKTLNVLANPLASFGRLTRGEDVNPGNIPRGENPFDAFVLGMVNPASWAESGQYAVKEAKQGNYLASGLNALGVLPIVPAGIKGASALKNIVKTSKPIRGTGLVKATHTPKTPKDVFTPNRTESYKIDVIKKENINYLKSDEYISKRMANTGESKESILRQIDDYIKELDETPISFQASDDMGDALGYYRKGDPFENIPSKIAIEEPQAAYQAIDKNMFGTIDHEIKHLLSPAQKLDKSSAIYKLWNSSKFKAGRKKYKQAIDDINDKFMKATSKEEADKIISMYDKIPNKEIYDGTFTSKIPTMEMSGVYKNYPTLKINNANKKTAEYLGAAREQQPRLLRGAQWVKDNFNWDGTKSGITDKMVNNIFDQMQNPKNLGGKTSIPDDFRELLENSKIYMSGTDEYGLHSVESYRKLKNVLSKAWATVPVAAGAGAATSEKKLGGFEDPQEKLEIDYSKPPVKKKKLATTEKETSFRQSMMNFLHNTNKVDTNYVNNVMQVIAEHESKNVDDAIQVSGDKETGFYDGPARGAYQYEMGKKRAASSAMNRSSRFTRDSIARPFTEFPTIYPEAKKESPDFSILSREDQDGLFLGDKMNKNKTESKEFYNLVKNDGTPPTSDEIFEFWGKNHKRLFVYKIQTRGGEQTVKYTYDKLPADKKALELKKWKARTKNKFKTGGIFTEENNPNLKVRKLVLKNTKKPKSKTDLELRADTISNAFNNYTNPTLINNENLNLQAALGINPNIGWNPNNKSFSKYGTPNLNLEGSFGLSGQYVKNNFSANAGVNFQTGNKPTYKAGIKYNFKSGGYKKKCKYGCW